MTDSSVKAVVVALLLLVAGCTGEKEAASPSPTPVRTATFTPTPTPSPSRVPGSCNDPSLKVSASLVRIRLKDGKVVSSRPLAPERPYEQRPGSLVTIDNTTGADVRLAEVERSPAPRLPFAKQGSHEHLVTRDGVAVFDTTAGIIGIQLSPRKERWRAYDLGFRTGHAESDGRTVYATGVRTTYVAPARDWVYAIAPGTGKVRWVKSLPIGLSGSELYLTDGRIVVPQSHRSQDEKAQVQAFDPTTGNRLWTTALSSQQVVASGISGGELVLVAQTSRLFCD